MSDQSCSSPAPCIEPTTRKPRKPRGPRGHRRIAALADRAFYLRREVCAIFGLSDKRLAELIDTDKDLPMIKNGRYQIFPKRAFDAWYQEAGNKRLTVSGSPTVPATHLKGSSL